MRDKLIEQVGELYRIANLIYDMGYRHGEKNKTLERYYKPDAIQIINRFLRRIESDERERTRAFMEDFKDIYDGS